MLAGCLISGWVAFYLISGCYWQVSTLFVAIIGRYLPYWWVGEGHFLSLCHLLLVALRGHRLDDVNLADITMVNYNGDYNADYIDDNVDVDVDGEGDVPLHLCPVHLSDCQPHIASH